MAARVLSAKTRRVAQRVAAPDMPLMIFGSEGLTFHIGEEQRARAEAALPPGAFALEVLRASRAVHGAERALRSAHNAEEALRLWAALESAEESLRSTLTLIESASGGPVEAAASLERNAPEQAQGSA